MINWATSIPDLALSFHEDNTSDTTYSKNIIYEIKIKEKYK